MSSDGGKFHNNNNNDAKTVIDNDGSGALPLAQYLHTLGISYTSIPSNCNTQEHTPAHKAAWGGNLPLLQYYRDIHGVYDIQYKMWQGIIVLILHA
jgi:hypothetical protein